MKRVLFILNDRAEFDFAHLLEKHLPGWQTEIAVEMPKDPRSYQLIILWNYRTVVSAIPEPNNVVIFHASDLPLGRGWAPIYHAIVEGCDDYTISAILVAPEVDTGDVVLRIRFPMLPNYTAAALRRFDCEASIMGIRKILERFGDRQVVGVPQRGRATYRKRRFPADNEIKIDRRFEELIPHLRACESLAPAFFEFKGVKYLISVTTEAPADFPQEIQFIFPEHEERSRD